MYLKNCIAQLNTDFYKSNSWQYHNSTNARLKSVICAVKMLRKAQKDTVNIAANKTGLFTVTSAKQMKISNYFKIFVLISNSTPAVLIKPLLKSSCLYFWKCLWSCAGDWTVHGHAHGFTWRLNIC